ncbi:MAG: hypothetical protein VR68_06420 [Peptococcaceae bacterium BRH_c4a]|nr:MAG: hypothetical protein VR68_06420 [Peptococcaceae bacterium BRH_c4a]
MKEILKNIIQLISYRESAGPEDFILEENLFDKKAVESNQGGSGEPPIFAEKEGADSVNEGRDEGSSQSKGRVRSRRRKKGESSGEEPEQQSNGGDQVHGSLEQNRNRIDQIYGLPVNKDLIVRSFTMGTSPPTGGFAIFIDGLADRTTVNLLLQNLMVHTRMYCNNEGSPASYIMKNLLPGSQIRTLDSFKKIADSVNYGDTAFFFQGSAQAIVVETKGWERRAVSRPNVEQTISGPQESFVENLRVNTGLVRKIIRSEKLFTELFQIGARFPSDVAVMYLKDLANPQLVEEVKRRISSITVDYVNDIGILEQFIEDDPYSMNSQTLSTERPDRVAALLAEGKVAILLGGSPFALVVPVTMYSQMHTGEEVYLRWQYGTFLRYIRTISFYLALLLPGSYLAVVLYHQEMVPTELLLFIAGNREKVPFPTLVEMLLMEFSFELVREAGLRIPGIIGSTIGIVGALILGQTAVQANIVSPILVILVAVTGLASFSIPSYSLAFAVRIYRFFYIIMGSVLGFFGISIVLYVQILLTTNLKSFGVPYLSPTGPRTHSGPDIVFRLPIFMHRRRPDYLNPQDDIRMSQNPRGWVEEGNGGEKQG